VTVSRFLARSLLGLEYRWSYIEEVIMVFRALFLEFRSQHVFDTVSLNCRVAVLL
jgi:hypothetical protein